MEQLPKIVRQRLQATDKAGVHPDADLLTAFAEKSLTEHERVEVLQHLARCADCRSVVSLAMPEVPAPPMISPKSFWLTWPVLRWGAVAACAVVVAAAVTLHYGRGRYEPRQEESRLDARSQPAQSQNVPSQNEQKKKEMQQEPGASTYVSSAAPKPAPLPNLTAERRVSKAANEKLAAKIPPPLPFQAGRDFEAKGKLAKRQENAMANSAAGASAAIGGTIGGVAGERSATGRKQPSPAENNAPRSDQWAAAQLADKQVTTRDELKSSGSPSAPAADSAAIAQSAPARMKSSIAKDDSDKKSVALEKESSVSPNLKTLKASNQAIPTWTLSSGGALQRSFDSGKTWQMIPVARNVSFRAFAANDFDVWVGGAAGALYHSSDAGQNWSRVTPVVKGESLTRTIVGVEFSDPQHGKLVTDGREIWTTSDGGSSWHRK